MRNIFKPKTAKSNIFKPVYESHDQVQEENKRFEQLIEEAESVGMCPQHLSEQYMFWNTYYDNNHNVIISNSYYKERNDWVYELLRSYIANYDPEKQLTKIMGAYVKNEKRDNN